MYEVGDASKKGSPAALTLTSDLGVLISSVDIAPIFAERFTFEQRISYEIHMLLNKFIF